MYLNLSYFFTLILFLSSLTAPLSAKISKIALHEQKMFLENEANTVQIYGQAVGSIVHVASIQQERQNWFTQRSSKIAEGTGSGFLWDKKGHIVTNYHVIANANSFLISFKDDKNQYRATLIGSEPKKDIAVLKLDKIPSTDIIPNKRGNSNDLMVGQKALAIGNPFGLDHSLSAGVISALERKIQGVGGVTIQGMIQTDSAINPGNSGGPLFNSKGEIIGMNTVIFSNSGQSAGIGFAVPVNTISRIVPQLIKFGQIIRPGLGISLAPDHLRPRFGIKEGIIIEYVSPQGPAGSAGLSGITQDRYGRWFLGDILLSIDGTKINSYDEIYHVLDKYKVDDTVEVTYLRKDRKKKIKIKLIKL